MKKLGLLTIAIGLTSMGTALANLPDEINYSPYENQYQVLSANVNRITSELNSAEDDLANAYTDEQVISNSIVEFQSANQGIISDINTSLRNLSTLKDNELDLEDRVDRLSRRVDKLTRDERQLARQINREDSRLDPIRNRLKQARQDVKRAKAQLESARSSLNTLKSRLQTQRNSLASLRTQKQSLKTQLENQQKQLQTIDTQIASLESRISGLPAQIQSAKRNLDKENQKLQTLNSELAAQRTELTDLMRTNRGDPRVVELRKALAAKARQVQAQGQVVAQANTSLESLKSQRQVLRQRISRLEAQKGGLPAQIQRTKTAIASNQTSINNQKVSVDRALAEVNKGESDVSKVQIVHADLKTKVDRINDNLARESRNLDQLLTQRNELQNLLADVIQRANARNNELAQTRSDIRSLESYIPNLRSTLRSNEAQIAKLENDLIVTRDDIVALNRSVNNLSAEQQNEVGKRDRKYQEYISRYNYYNENLTNARELGAGQTDSATQSAISLSNNYVSTRSNDLGQSMGEKQATVQANFWASVRAELRGHADGYQEGVASEADIARGESEGRAAGIQDANDYATQVLKPQFFNDFFTSELAQNSTVSKQFLVKKASEVRSEDIELGINKLFNFSTVIEPITDGELQASKGLVTPLDTIIVDFQENYLLTNNQVEDLSKPENAFESPKNVPFGQPNCNGVYKNVPEFKSACMASYRDRFESIFRTVFYDNFVAQYENLYSQKLTAKRDSLIESKYNNAFETHYVTAKNAGISDGKRDIFAKVYARAKELAYSDQLPVATSTVKNVAKTEVTNWIANNATLTLNGSKIEGDQLRGNSKAKLVLSLKNISPTDLASPVKVIITEAVNAVVSQREYFINIAPGSQVTDFKEIDFLVDSRARSDQEIKISGEIILSGGKYKAQRSESFTAKAVTVVNPALSSSLEYDSTPQVVTSVRRRTLIHNLNTSISPSVENVNNGYLVTLSAAPGFQGMIQFKNTSFRTRGINYGRSQNIRFQYTFPRSSEDKLVKVLVTYSYQGEVVKTDIVDLRPH